MGQFGVNLRNTSVDVSVKMGEKVKFRVLPRNDFDDKGNVKPFKPDPKDPDRRLGGVSGKFEDIEKDHWVAVKLRRNKTGSVYIAEVVVVLGKEGDGPPSPPTTKKK